MPSGADQTTGAADADWETFSGLHQMKNHWDRAGWHPGRMAYYWYLSFRNAHAVQVLAADCQAVVDGPHFDTVDLSDLHMTLERVACAEDIDAAGLTTVQEFATRRLGGFGAFDLTVGPLAGSDEALSFSASPRARVSDLRVSLLKATQTAGYALDISDSRPFRPHVGIAYCNRSVDVRPIVEQVRSLRTLRRVTVNISEALLVALTRNERSYSWEITHRVLLAPAPLDSDVSTV